MIRLTLAEVVAALRGAAPPETPAVSVGGVSTDSRSVRPGELFFALCGERFDGHEFVTDALQRGALGVVVDERRAEELHRALARPAAAPPLLIAVDDPLRALGRLGAYHRRQVPAAVIAVVGSNGKTTTKAMIDHVLGGKFRGRCSPRSFNNAIGVPLTLLSAEAGDDYLVVEIGTNAPGEVAELAALAAPDVAILTSIGEEHLERLRDLEGVAAEECSVLSHVRDGGFAAINIDAPQVAAHLPAGRVKLATFGAAADAALRVTRIAYDAPWLRFEINGRFPYRLHMPGPHNASNAAGAIAVALRLGLTHDEIAERLQSFVPPPMRSEVLRVGPITVVNDAYNANPHSALAALGTLAAVAGAGRRIVVFGEMRELGEQAARQHERVAESLRQQRLDHVVLVGRAADWMFDRLSGGDLFCPSVERCAGVEECGERLADILRPGDVVLLKASRAVGLERVIEALRRRFAEAPTTPEAPTPEAPTREAPTSEAPTSEASGAASTHAPAAHANRTRSASEGEPLQQGGAGRRMR